jgi:AraC-like DNA-binding protein
LRDPRATRLKISEIALEAGFPDLSHFNRSFRRRFGNTPSAVRADAARLENE